MAGSSGLKIRCIVHGSAWRINQSTGMAELTTNSPFCGINCQFRSVKNQLNSSLDSMMIPRFGLGESILKHSRISPPCCSLQPNVVLSAGRKCLVYLEGTLSSGIFSAAKRDRHFILWKHLTSFFSVLPARYHRGEFLKKNKGCVTLWWPCHLH
jgi:hypothetical protein